jgi:hypothetical protein
MTSVPNIGGACVAARAVREKLGCAHIRRGPAGYPAVLERPVRASARPVLRNGSSWAPPARCGCPPIHCRYSGHPLADINTGQQCPQSLSQTPFGICPLLSFLVMNDIHIYCVLSSYPSLQLLKCRSMFPFRGLEATSGHGSPRFGLLRTFLAQRPAD